MSLGEFRDARINDNARQFVGMCLHVLDDPEWESPGPSALTDIGKPEPDPDTGQVTVEEYTAFALDLAYGAVRALTVVVAAAALHGLDRRELVARAALELAERE